MHIAGVGEVQWAVHATDGSLRVLKIPAYCVPSSPVRLISTTSFLKAYSGETILLEDTKATLSGIDGDPSRKPVVVPVKQSNQLYVSQTWHPSEVVEACASHAAVDDFEALINVVHDSNRNLSNAEKELLRWHFRLGHLSMNKVQALLRTSKLASSDNQRKLHRAAAKVKPPMCAACQYGKQCWSSTPGSGSKPEGVQGVTKQEATLPGQRIFVDHFYCSDPGRTWESKGKASSDHCVGGVIFMDSASSFMHVEFVEHFNTHETLAAKECFEQCCQDVGIVPQSHVLDRGPLPS